MSTIDEVKDRADIVDVISTYVSLKKAGRNYKGLCPFHTEKTPSFVVFPDTQSWHCFGACGTGGDVFAFVMRAENVEFADALKILAQRVGVELRAKTEAERVEEDRQHRLLEVHKLAAAYFHNRLLFSPDGETARSYLNRRGINQETIERFQLGYAPNDWHALGSYLTGKGYSSDDLLVSGLVIAQDSGTGYYDRFRNRVIIPIRDHAGRTIAFGGRVLDDSQPKYLNSPETPLFEKGRVLFGLDLAKAAARAEDTAVVVEGYMDVIQAHQHGKTNVVAAMGTALTADQVKLLRKYARTIILALDPDAAGSQAVIRGLDLSREVTLHEVVRIGSAVVESQYSSEADVRIAVLPQGKDPDDVLRETPDLWSQLMQSALPVIDYYFELMRRQFDLSSAQGKAQAAEHLLPVLRDIENPIQRAHYVQKLSHLLHVDEKILQEQLASYRRRKVGQKDAWQTVQDVHLRRPSFDVEEHCLAILWVWPHTLVEANRVLSEMSMLPLGPDDFSSVENRELFLAIQKQREQSSDLAQDEFLSNLNQPLADHLRRLLAYWETLPKLPDEQVEIEAVRSILKLRHFVIGKWLRQLHILQGDAEQEGDAASTDLYRRLVQNYAERKNRLQRAIYAAQSRQWSIARRHSGPTVGG